MASRKRSLSNDADVSALYKELDEASCPICMDHPHNAVLLICSSHDKGCRSYICDTSYRHSNCLDRFRKLREENKDILHSRTSGDLTVETGEDTNHIQILSNTAATMGLPGGSGSTQDENSNFEEQGTLWGRLDLGETDMEKSEPISNLSCPLCRGSVLGWKVVEEARKYLNLKSRSCSRESCSFLGNYRELRRHARRVHPTVRPADVDPTRQQAWQRFEDQREYSDIVSAIRSAIPGAEVLGDYVIENGDRVSGERERGEGGRWLSTFFLFQMISSMEPGGELRGGRSRAFARHRRPTGTFSRRRYLWGENLLGLQDDDEDDDGDDEPDPNILSNVDEDVPPNPRRRRRLTRARSHEDQQ
ncbi:uncharacterized protein LOC111378855 isoform X2 [Olea europaea var. sylvestris]|uniref:Uncharacterized protein n=2 Tax=Olea europaea subsp. europaea TaxID=158383 RepID=A0A8S0PFB7_OLEEU|nr:uncharacterized protein LOC111378855 isoform X2 [Olea europaea var. sylvestris]XP_022857907.1 uncharacterized protein LOC111378855 isoform X2 [Olea europaea var. sylvestris]XP_022857908.1 uncharacterized protein LOC111378855 isoform X2 [Olea europaea var. sylvestris]CAA2946933.1 Hypothetical predicted protein [Olea europaea subsp. europaea]